jgi:hypothetical protein
MRDLVIIEFRPSPGPSGLDTSPGAKTFIRGAVLHNQILVEPFLVLKYKILDEFFQNSSGPGERSPPGLARGACPLG